MNLNRVSLGRKKGVALVGLLFFINLLIFQYTVDLRKPWMGVLAGSTESTGNHHWLTAHTVLFTKNWFVEGISSLNFTMVRNPASVEFPTLKDRHLYLSYPQGSFLPIYAISKIKNSEPTPSMVMKYNLLNHFLISFFLSLTTYFFLLQLKFSHLNSFLFSLIPISMALLLPGPMYFFQNIYLADQAIILPTVFFIFLEVVRGNIQNETISRGRSLLQALVMFYGAFTDWFFLFTALAVYLKRILNGELGKNLYSFIKTSIFYWIPVALAISIYFIHIHSLDINPINYMTNKFFRSGLGSTSDKDYSVFTSLLRHLKYNFGDLSKWLLLLSILAFIVSFLASVFNFLKRSSQKEGIRKIISLMGFTLVPGITHFFTFEFHSSVHSFAALKFLIPLAIVPFVLVPILIFYVFKSEITSISLEGLTILYNKRRISLKLPILVLLLVITAVTYSLNEHPRYNKIFPKANKDLINIGGFISGNTDYNDIVFSPNYPIPEVPPQQLSYSMKRVYKLDSLDYIENKVKGIREPYVINIFSIDNDTTKKTLGNLIQHSYDIKQEQDLYLYKIKPADFFDFISNE